MHVITVATDDNNWLDDWKASAEKWGYKYTILGKGREWEGFSTKIKLIIEFLESREKNEIIVIVDAYDLILAGPPDELEKKFLSFRSPIVAGGEDVCIMNCHKHSCKVNNERYKWVNGGCVVGYVENLIDMYKYTLKVSPQDDQIGVGKYMDENPELVSVDGNQMIVANIRSTVEIRCVKGERFQHKETNYIPVIVHMPFMYADLGARSELVRTHTIENYESPPFLTYTQGLFSHLYKHLTKNPAYAPVLYGLYAVGIIVSLIILYYVWKHFNASKTIK